MNSNAQSPFRSFPFSPIESHIERIGSFNNLAVAFSGAIKPKKLVLSNFQRDTKRLPPIQMSLDNKMPLDLKQKRKQVPDGEWNAINIEVGPGPYKKSILLKRQMSETRFQEYKRQQMQQMTEEMKNENIDTFLQTQKPREKMSKSIDLNPLDKQRLFKLQPDGAIAKRSILGTPDVFLAIQSKAIDHGTKKKITTQPSGSLQGIMINRGTTLSTPQSKMFKATRTSIDLSNFGFHSNQQPDKQQQKGVNFQSAKPQPKPQMTINNAQIDMLKQRLEERIKYNDSQEQSLLQMTLPANVMMRESQSQRILTQYSKTMDYWERQKARFAQMAGKSVPEMGIMQKTDEFRKKVEAQELVDKSNINVQSTGITIWKANLRIYNEESKYKTQSQLFAKQSQHQTEEMVRREAYAKQKKLEEKEASKTFLPADSIGSNADIGSFYLDRSFKPTEIVRTPNFELAKQIQDFTNSSILKLENSTEHQTAQHQYQHPWWNETIKEDVIQEEIYDDDPLHKTSDSIQQHFSNTSFNQTHTQQFLPKVKSTQAMYPFVSASNGPAIKQEDMIKASVTTSQFYPFSSQLGYSSLSQLSRRKRDQNELLEKTMNRIKEKHSHLIANTCEDDLSVLCVQGVKKLDIEVEGAKKIPGSKVLLDQNTINGDDEDATTRDKEEILAFHYDQKLFY